MGGHSIYCSPRKCICSLHLDGGTLQKGVVGGPSPSGTGVLWRGGKGPRKAAVEGRPCDDRRLETEISRDTSPPAPRPWTSFHTGPAGRSGSRENGGSRGRGGRGSWCLAGPTLSLPAGGTEKGGTEDRTKPYRYNTDAASRSQSSLGFHTPVIWARAVSLGLWEYTSGWTGQGTLLSMGQSPGSPWGLSSSSPTRGDAGLLQDPQASPETPRLCYLLSGLKSSWSWILWACSQKC